MPKSEYACVMIDKEMCGPLLREHHYLSSISRGFKSGFNVGLIFEGRIVGVCIFTGWPVPELLNGCYGLRRNDQAGFWELSRLVLDPRNQSAEHNLASWFVSKSMRMLRKREKVRAVLSYADNDHHKGTVYAAANFKYYGMTAPKKDFWIRQEGGNFTKHSRGKVKGVDGEWRHRSQKHRFLVTVDKTLTCQWREEKWTPKEMRV